MSIPVRIEVLFMGMAAVLAVLVAFRAELIRARGGKVLAFISLFILPVLAVWTGFSQQMDRAETTRFCLSCHVMTDYGRSLYVDDPSYVPARHFQNNHVPRDHACYTCHTNYTIFGDVNAKWRGVRHLYVQYFGRVPKPAEIKLYEPFSSRECLHCHDGMRIFEESAEHHKMPDLMAQIKSHQLSCVSSNCHDTIHDVDSLKDVTFWKGGE